MSSRSDGLQMAEVIGTWAAALTVIIGGMFGIFQFLDYKQTLRVERSMAFIDRYHDNEPLVAARIHITDIMNRRIGTILEVLQQEQTDPAQLAQAYAREVLTMVEEEGLAVPLEQVFGFYEQILMCREMSLCDDSVAESFFDTDGRAFVRSFYPYICRLRTEWNNPAAYQRVLSFYIGDTADVCE